MDWNKFIVLGLLVLILLNGCVESIDLSEVQGTVNLTDLVDEENISCYRNYFDGTRKISCPTILIKQNENTENYMNIDYTTLITLSYIKGFEDAEKELQKKSAEELVKTATNKAREISNCINKELGSDKEQEEVQEIEIIKTGKEYDLNTIIVVSAKDEIKSSDLNFVYSRSNPELCIFDGFDLVLENDLGWVFAEQTNYFEEIDCDKQPLKCSSLYNPNKQYWVSKELYSLSKKDESNKCKWKFMEK